MKNCKPKHCFALVVSLLLLLSVFGCSSYNMEFRSFSSIRFKDQFDNFTFHTKPVTRYELGMLFSPSIPDISPETKVDKILPLPPVLGQWIKDSIGESQKTEILEKFIDVSNINSTNEPITITENLDLEIVVPGLKELLTLFDAENFRTGTRVTVSADKLVRRRLVWSEVLKAVKNGQIKKEIADIITGEEKGYVIAAEDLTAYGYRVRIKVNRHTNPELLFAMEDAFKRHMKPENIYFNLSAINPFAFAIEEPVAIAALWKKRPDKDSMEKISPPPLFEDINTWEPVQIPLDTLYYMEARGPKKIKQ